MVFVGNVAGKTAIIIDDIADACGTLAMAAKVGIQNGATDAFAIVTLGFLQRKPWFRRRVIFNVLYARRGVVLIKWPAERPPRGSSGVHQSSLPFRLQASNFAPRSSDCEQSHHTLAELRPYGHSLALSLRGFLC